jgi:hypothetical protein
MRVEHCAISISRLDEFSVSEAKVRRRPKRGFAELKADTMSKANIENFTGANRKPELSKRRRRFLLAQIRAIERVGFIFPPEPRRFSRPF